VDLVIGCVLKVTIEKVLEALTEGHHQVVRAVMIIARRIALMIYFLGTPFAGRFFPFLLIFSFFTFSSGQTGPNASLR
jgi:hypothetical protein